MTRLHHDEAPGLWSRWQEQSGGPADDGARAIASSIIERIMDGYTGPVALSVGEGPAIRGPAEPACRMRFNDPGVIRELVLRRDLARLAEAYLAGAIDVEGDMEALFSLVSHLEGLRLPLAARLSLLRQALRLPPAKRGLPDLPPASPRGRRNSRAAISHHYDVGNDFYRLWLDPEMVYSCAYFREPSRSLAEAQRDKLDHICRKLRLRPGMVLLDIGCGWGALALWAARHYGVRVHGITLSRAQQALARRRVEEAGLGGQVRIELRDYRELPDEPRYDRVVSVGMFEHVGLKNFPRYFGKVRSVIRPGGLFLNHGITSETRWQRTDLTRFINRHVFPDGELTRISHVLQAMEDAGFEILDLESLRRHYALTLRHWVRSLEANHEAAVALTSERCYRVWRLYMAGSAFYFEEGSIGVDQVLAGLRHAPLQLPMTREDLYLPQGPGDGGRGHG